MIIIDDIIQGTPEWKQLRAGVVTASNMHKIISAVNGEYSKSSDKYMIKLIAEKLTGEIDEEYSNQKMERGLIMQDEAIDWYRFTTGNEPRKVGFVFRDEQRLTGCSPDSLMDDRGLELKCVIGSTMVTYLLGSQNEIINEYKQQVQGSMWITDFQSWELLIYHPDFDPILITVKRDNEYISKLEMHLSKFNKELTAKYNQLRKSE